MVSDVDILEKRQNRIEDAIERLTEISADLNKMLAVQEQRLSQHEKNMTTIEDIIETRRLELDAKFNNVYSVMRSEDTKIVDQLEAMRKEQKEQHSIISDKITTMEKIIWTYLGGFSVIVFLISYGPKILEFLAAK